MADNFTNDNNNNNDDDMFNFLGIEPPEDDGDDDNNSTDNNDDDSIALFTDEDLKKVLTPKQLEELNIKENKRRRDMGSFSIEKGLPECLSDLGKNLNEEKPVVFFRDEVISEILQGLSTKNHSNIMLVGPTGVGKTAIIKEIARQLKLYKSMPQKILGDDTFIAELQLGGLLAGTRYRGDLEERMQRIITYLQNSANQVILYIDEIHQLITNRNLSEVAEQIKPLLTDGKVQIIGSTTTQEYRFLQKNPAFNRRFSEVNVPELTHEQTFNVLQKLIPQYQDYYGYDTSLSDAFLEQVINLSEKHKIFLASNQPDLAISLLDRILALSHFKKLANQDERPIQLTKDSVEIKEIETKLLKKPAKQKLNLNNFRSLLNKELIGQAKAKQELLSVVKSLILNIRHSGRPQSLLFAGPSGTGKTQAAKILTKFLLNREDSLININMTEYSTADSIYKLIGNIPNQYDKTAQVLPLDSLKSNPYQVILLDEFEKAHPTVQKIFMQALDEGHIRMNDGSQLDFSQAIVIHTSNAGSEEFKDEQKHIGFVESKLADQDLSRILSKYFSPELLNRMEHVVNFNPLTKAEYQQILQLELVKQLKHLRTKNDNVTIVGAIPTQATNTIQKLADKTYDPLKNGRPAKRVINKYLENLIFKQVDFTLDCNQID